MFNSSALLIIKPLSIGRGDGPSILFDCLNKTDLALVKFRQWTPCSTTMDAMGSQAVTDLFPLPKKQPVWVCLFTSLDNKQDPYTALNVLWADNSVLSIRRKYQQNIHPSDTLVRITQPNRLLLEQALLF